MEEPADDVLKFFEDEIDTVPHLEALVLLWEDRPRAFTSSEVARRIFVKNGVASSILRQLTAKRFLVFDAEAKQYAYNSTCSANEHVIPRVAVTYRQHLIRVATLIHAKASPGIREFARAFERNKE
jgi:hypothetical protein